MVISYIIEYTIIYIEIGFNALCRRFNGVFLFAGVITFGRH